MKSKKFILIAFILTGIFLIGAVSASENATDNNATQEILSQEVPIEESVSEVNESEIANDINVTFEKQMWKENLSDINVQLPENASGTFCLKIDDEIIYNENITNKSFSIPIKLPKPRFIIIANLWPPIDYETYRVTAFYNDIQLNITDSLKVMKYSPHADVWWNFPSEVLQHGDGYTMTSIMFPRSANGKAEIYVDDRLIFNSNVTNPFVYLNRTDIVDLALGNHTLRIVYHGDEYYLPANKTLNFTITNVVIDIPQIVNIGHDDCISVEVLEGVTGKVNIYIDNVLVSSEKIKGGGYVKSLADYLKWNSSEVKVVFESKSLSRTKTVPIEIKFDFEVYIDSYVYGEEGTLEITLPDNLNNNLLTVTIDGVKYKFKHPEYIMNNIVEVDISKLTAGNYTVVISYPGDEKFTNKTVTHNFTVYYDIQYPYDVEYKSGEYVYLKLPSNATGTLNLYVNGVFYKAAKVTKGKATIKVDDLAPGFYDLEGAYDGNDYYVASSSTWLSVSPKITLTYFFTAGEDKYITVQVPKTAKGYVIFEIDGKKHKCTVKNGIAKYSMKNLKRGEHEIFVDFHSNGELQSREWIVVTVYTPKIKTVSAKLYTTGLNAKFKVLSRKNKPISGAKVTFKFNGKTVNAKTNKKGIVTLKLNGKLSVKKYRLSVTCKGSKISKILKAKSVVNLKGVNVRKSAENLVLTATLKTGKQAIKNKKVTFKFNGKKYSAKTNKKGVAKVTIKNSVLSKLEVGKKVTYSATYFKDTAKKTVKVGK